MFLWLMVALKVPICALLYLVWWATRAPEDADTGGGRDCVSGAVVREG